MALSISESEHFMTISDPTLAATLAALSTPQELRDPEGRVLGRYVPAIPGMSFPEIGLTDAELDAIANDPDGWVPASEVEARLQTLGRTL